MAERTITYRVTAATQGFTAGMTRASASAQQSASRIGSSMQRNRQALTAAGTAAVGFGAAVGIGLGQAVSAGAEFESKMNQVRAVSGATGAEFSQLSGIAREMGRSTMFGASEAAEGLSFLSMAGFEAQESVEALPGVLDLAAAGQMELGRSADIASNVLQGFGLAADETMRVVDTMAATFTSSNTSLEQMGRSLSFVAPVANSAGLELEETAAAIGLMGDAGIQGSRAGTAMRQSIARLLRPVGQAKEVIGELGLSVTTSDGQLQSLTEIMGQLEDAGATTADVVGLFGQEAGPAMAALLERGSGALADFADDLEDSGGAAEAVAETQMEGLRGSMTELGSAFEGLQIKIAESGLLGGLEGLADATTGFVRTVEELPDPVVKAGTTVAGLSGAASIAGGAFLILAPRVLDLADRFRQSRAAGGAFYRTMSRFSRGALKVGAVTALAGAFDAVGDALVDVQRGDLDLSGLTSDLADFAETGAMAGNFARSFSRDIDDLAGQLELAANRIDLPFQFMDPEGNRALEEMEALDNALTELFDQDPELGEQAWERLTNQLRDAGVSVDDIEKRLPTMSEEVKVASLESLQAAVNLRELSAQGGNVQMAMLGVTDEAERLGTMVGPLDHLIDDTSESSGQLASEWANLALETGGLSANMDDLTGRQEVLADALQAMRDPTAVYTGLLDEKESAEREAAEALAESTEDSSDSWEDFASDVDVSLGEYATALEENVENTREFGNNLVGIANRFGADVASEIAAMGEEGVELAAKMADDTTGEAQRLADALRENAQIGGADMVGELDAAMAVAEETTKLGGRATARTLAHELDLGVKEVKRIADQYGIDLAEGINPVLTGIGQSPVRPKGSQDFVMAAGGVVGPHIASSPSVLFGERGPESYIPLYEGHGASRERSVQIWEETGRRLGIDPEPTAMATGGFTGVGDVPAVPDVSHRGDMVGHAGDAAMSHLRDEAVAWLEENLVPELGRGVGWQAMWDALSQQFPGADLISALRPGAITATGNPSYHGMGRAVDVSPRMDIFNWLAEHYPGSRELIFSPAGGRQLHNGSSHVYGEPTRGDHWDHIHWAMARGGIIPSYDSGGTWPAGTLGVNSSGSDETVIPGGMADGSVYESPDGAFLKLGSGGNAEWFQATGLGQLAGIEALFGEAQQRPSSHIGASQGSVVDLFGGPGGVEDAVENLREIRFEAMDLDGQIADVEGRLAEETPFSDEWMRLFDDRSRLLDEQEQQREEAAEEQRRRDEEIAENRRQYLFEQMDLEEQIADVGQRLKNEERFSNEWMRLHDQRESLLEEQRRRDEQAAEERRQREEDIAALVRDFEEDRAGLIDDRADSLAGWVDATRQMSHDRGIFAGQLEANVVDQTERMREAAAGLSTLRDRGLSQEAIEHLGLRSPSALGQIRTLLHDDPEAIAELSEAFEAMLGEAEGIAEGEAEDSRTRLSDDLASLGDDVVGQLQELGATMVEVRDLLGGKVEGLPEFASGGMVPGSGPQRIVAHGGERILSQSDNRALIDAVRQAGSGGLRAGDRLTLEVEGQPITAIVRREQASHDRAFESEMAGR